MTSMDSCGKSILDIGAVKHSSKVGACMMRQEHSEWEVEEEMSKEDRKLWCESSDVAGKWYQRRH